MLSACKSSWTSSLIGNDSKYHLIDNDSKFHGAQATLLVCHIIHLIYGYFLWYDMIWYEMIWYDMIWYDMFIWNVRMRHNILGCALLMDSYGLQGNIRCSFHGFIDKTYVCKKMIYKLHIMGHNSIWLLDVMPYLAFALNFATWLYYSLVN